MNGFLLDTNVVSELTRPRPDARVTDWMNAADEDLLYVYNGTNCPLPSFTPQPSSQSVCAGGTVGLAQFVNNAKGDGNQLMVMGITMVGAILTNKAPVGAYRGYGQPESCFVRELLIDRLAKRLDIDRVQLRAQNMVRPEDMPWKSTSGAIYDSGDYEACLRMAAEGLVLSTTRGGGT